MRRGFTLVEIMIAIILVSIIYMFAINSFTKNSQKLDQKTTLVNLKQTLLEQEYDESITVKCIEDNFSCFVFKDGQIQEDIIPPLFDELPTVYQYSKEIEKIEFVDLDLERLQRYIIVFEYSCDNSKRCSELIVETNTKTYIFNDLEKTPIEVEYINDIDEYFEKKVREVKDAF